MTSLSAASRICDNEPPRLPLADFDPRIARRQPLAPAAASAAPLVTAADLTPYEDLRDAWLASESAKSWHFASCARRVMSALI
jgi:hypothetical protein